MRPVTTCQPLSPRVFVDADVLFAGSASPSQHGASLVVLRMAEITLINAYTSQQVIGEARRNLAKKIPKALPTFEVLVSRCLTIVTNPSRGDLAAYHGLADVSDLPVLVAALRSECPWLVSFNTKHYMPGHPAVKVLPPGDFLLRIRSILAGLS